MLTDHNNNHDDKLSPTSLENDGSGPIEDVQFGVPVRRWSDVVYADVSGVSLVMDITVPRATGPVPVVAYLHGGAFAMGSHKASETAIPARPIWAALLGAGFAVASVQYRLSAEAIFPACVHDVHAAVRWLRAYGPDLGLDPNRIAAWGDSAGGYLAAMLALDIDDESVTGVLGVPDVSAHVTAAVSWYPPTNFTTMDAQAIPGSVVSHSAPDSPESQLIGATVHDEPELALRASPVSYVTANAAPLLLLHGSLDRTVPAGQSAEIYELLTAAGAPVEFDLIDGADHVFMAVDFEPVIEKSIAYLKKHVL